MKTELLKRARAHFHSGNARIDRHNQLAWARSVRLLGDKWLLARPMGRLETAK